MLDLQGGLPPPTIPRTYKLCLKACQIWIDFWLIVSIAAFHLHLLGNRGPFLFVATFAVMISLGTGLIALPIRWILGKALERKGFSHSAESVSVPRGWKIASGLGLGTTVIAGGILAFVFTGSFGAMPLELLLGGVYLLGVLFRARARSRLAGLRVAPESMVAKSETIYFVARVPQRCRHGLDIVASAGLLVLIALLLSGGYMVLTDRKSWSLMHYLLPPPGFEVPYLTLLLVSVLWGFARTSGDQDFQQDGLSIKILRTLVLALKSAMIAFLILAGLLLLKRSIGE